MSSDRTKPRMVRVYWKARVHLDSLIGELWWSHCQDGIWWVLPVCKHWDKPSKRRSKREDGPTTVPCYQCPLTAEIDKREGT